jgi:hypothetical protein
LSLESVHASDAGQRKQPPPHPVQRATRHPVRRAKTAVNVPSENSNSLSNQTSRSLTLQSHFRHPFSWNNVPHCNGMATIAQTPSDSESTSTDCPGAKEHEPASDVTVRVARKRTDGPLRRVVRDPVHTVTVRLHRLVIKTADPHGALAGKFEGHFARGRAQDCATIFLENACVRTTDGGR